MELAHGVFVRIFYICIVLAHQGWVYDTHEVRLLVSHDGLVELPFNWVVDRVSAMPVIPFFRHGLGDNAFGFVYGLIVLRKILGVKV